MSVDSTIERGTLRSGSFTSLPTYVISIQPSYAHNAATIATPNGAIRLPTGAGGQSGDRFATLPPGSTNPATINTASKPNLIEVSTFWVIAPSRPRRTVSRSQIHLRPTRLGHRGAEFRHGERPEQRHQAAHDPYEKRRQGGVELESDGARHDEDRRRDDGPHVDHRGVEQTELALE